MTHPTHSISECIRRGILPQGYALSPHDVGCPLTSDDDEGGDEGFGIVQPGDVGKRCYRTGGVFSMENAEQRDTRARRNVRGRPRATVRRLRASGGGENIRDTIDATTTSGRMGQPEWSTAILRHVSTRGAETVIYLSEAARRTIVRDLLGPDAIVELRHAFRDRGGSEVKRVLLDMDY